MKKMIVVMMLMGIGVTNAYAIAPCSQVCTGNTEPCQLRCYLDNHFVTTCDQVYGGRCTRFAIDDAVDADVEPVVCEAEVEVMPIVADWIHAGVAAAGNVASAFGVVLG